MTKPACKRTLVFSTGLPDGSTAVQHLLIPGKLVGQ